MRIFADENLMCSALFGYNFVNSKILLYRYVDKQIENLGYFEA